MNLREDKGWSYGARSVFVGARGQRPFFTYAQVQTDKTAESMVEILAEMRAITSTQPPSEDEITLAKSIKTLSLPGRWETIDAIASSISQIVRFG